MISATERSKSRVQDLLDRANSVQTDSKQQERRFAVLCKGCFYFPSIGGAAITKRPCMCCGADVIYGSTATDVLCQNCAKETDLCKRCGGDAELRVRRKVWPTTKATNESSE